MREQVIISISREFGSGGHVIAEGLAHRFGLTMYDSNLLKEILTDRNLSHEELEIYDEVPKNRLFYRSVRGHSNSPEENVANMQFEFLKEKAAMGESFVIVGRCSESVLKDCPALISIFVLADMQCKVDRIKKLHNLSTQEAEQMIAKYDKKRKSYHNYYCTIKWGDSRNYDLSVNSSRLGIEKTIDFLEEYVKERMNCE
jgi:cytidylate kinase